MSLGNMSIEIVWVDNLDQVDQPASVIVDAFSEHAWMRSTNLLTTEGLRRMGKMMVEHSLSPDKLRAVAPGPKWQNQDMNHYQSIPDLYIKVLPADSRGVVPLMIGMPVEDNPDSEASCQIGIEAELGALERFGKRLMNIAERKQLARCAMYELSEWEESCMEHAERRSR